MKFRFQVTPKGWTEIERIYTNRESRRVFIAMDFGDKDFRAPLQQTIRDACHQAGGWEAFTIDEEKYLGGITDAIIAKINQSRFVVAEFTKNNRGVYYEAGYAAGRGLPVIYVVKSSDVKELHFDTRHIAHITWDTLDELKQKLIDYIGAVINK